MLQFIIGTYASQGLPSLFGLEIDNSKMRILWENSEALNPSYLYLHPNGKVLYAVEELIPNGRLAVFRKCKFGWRLHERYAAGSSPCHIEYSNHLSKLFVSNYEDGSITVYNVDDSGLKLHVCKTIRHYGKGVNPLRQAGPHMHSCFCLLDLVYAADLGLDSIFVYQNTQDELSELSVISLPSGCGVRHMAYHPHFSELIYANGEMSGEVYVINRCNSKLLQSLPAVLEKDQGFGSSAVKIFGNQLYVATRGCDRIACYTFQNSGLLQPNGIFSLKPSFPRDIFPFDNGMITANQESHSLSLMKHGSNDFPLLDEVFIGEAQPACIIRDNSLHYDD